MKLIFPINLYRKLRQYVEGINYEISGFGKITLINKQDILVEDIKIFKQEVTGGGTTIDRRTLARFYDELIQWGEDLRKWKMWWHSHADMETFWSNIDVQTIEDFDNEMPSDNWMLSLETNHNASILTRLDIFSPIRCTIHKIDWDITLPDEKPDENILDEITEKVKIILPRLPRRIYRPSKTHDIRTITWPGEKDIENIMNSSDLSRGEEA